LSGCKEEWLTYGRIHGGNGKEKVEGQAPIDRKGTRDGERRNGWSARERTK